MEFLYISAMDVIKYVPALLIAVMMTACNEASIRSFDNKEINALLVQVDENDERFIQKNVVFDSIVTRAGQRSLDNKTDRFKIKLFYFGDYARGYFNLALQDEKNLQVFGKRIGEYWVFKCVTKINMEEAGGYLILESDGSGIWSNGHVNFKKGVIDLKKQITDYSSLENW